jgi:hypothetical protein
MGRTGTWPDVFGKPRECRLLEVKPGWHIVKQPASEPVAGHRKNRRLAKGEAVSCMTFQYG